MDLRASLQNRFGETTDFRDTTEALTAFAVDPKALLNGMTARQLQSTPSRILICRPNSRLGNTLLLTPLVQELEALFPGAEVDIVTACPAAAEIFREYPTVRTIHQLPRFGALHPAATLHKFFASRSTPYDLVIDPCPRSKSGRFWTRFMTARADKLGFASPSKSKGVNYSVPFDGAPTHMAHYPVDLIRRGMSLRSTERKRPSFPSLSIRLTAAERKVGEQTVHNILGTKDPRRSVVSLFLEATGEKRLPVDFWRQLVRRLRAELPNVDFLEIVAAHGKRLMPETHSFFSTHIRRMAGVIDATDFFVSADCGVMHLGAATDTATLGLFKITDAAKYGPSGGGSSAISIDRQDPSRSIDEIARRVVSALLVSEAHAVRI